MVNIHCPACDSYMHLRSGHSHIKLYFCDNSLNCPVINEYSVSPNACINTETNEIFTYYFGVIVYNKIYLIANVFGSPNHIVVQNDKKILCKLDYIVFNANSFKHEIDDLILRLRKLVTLI